jgi:hypothetical protein
MDTRAQFVNFLEKYQNVSLYHDLDISGLPVDEQGFQSPENKRFFGDVFNTFRPRCLFELGSWKGTSAIMFARLMLKYCENPVIACVDTWIGSIEHWTSAEGRKRLALRHGYPSLYERFATNIVRASVAAYVTPLPMLTKTAIELAKRSRVCVDAVYVDASHEYAEVLEDVCGVWDLIGEDGILIADDYNAPGVRRAIQEFCERPGVFGLYNAGVPWPEALIVKKQVMRERAIAGHTSLIDIPRGITASTA